MISNWKEYTLERVESFLNSADNLNNFHLEINCDAGDSIPSISGTFSYNPPRVEVLDDGTCVANITRVKDDCVRWMNL